MHLPCASSVDAMPFVREILTCSQCICCMAIYSMSVRYSVTGATNKAQVKHTNISCSHVRLLGIDISTDLSLDHHISRICVGCYYRPCQLRRLRQSLDSNSLSTLIYAAVNSRIDYCNTALAGAPRTVTDKLQHVLNAAVCVVTGTRKFDHGLVRYYTVSQKNFPPFNSL